VSFVNDDKDLRHFSTAPQITSFFRFPLKPCKGGRPHACQLRRRAGRGLTIHGSRVGRQRWKEESLLLPIASHQRPTDGETRQSFGLRNRSLLACVTRTGNYTEGTDDFLFSRFTGSRARPLASTGSALVGSHHVDRPLPTN
jgi:hypothetical protein